MSSPLELVERYIAAVKFWLPKRLAEDVGAELLEDIRCEIEAAERNKGRPLSDDEIAAILKARGNPLAVAGRYLPARHLIGPELFPLYLFVLKIVAAICLVFPLLAWIARLVLDHSAPMPNVWAAPINSLLVSFAIVTLVFALIEHNGIDVNKRQDWNPKSLRPVKDRNRVPRSNSIGEIIGALIGFGFYAAGYLSLTSYHFLAGGGINLAPEWIVFWQIIVALLFGEVILSVTNLFQPHWTGIKIVAWLALNLAKTAAFCWLFQSHLVRGFTGFPAPAAAAFTRMSDQAADYALPFFGLVAAVLLATALWRIGRTLRRPA